MLEMDFTFLPADISPVVAAVLIFSAGFTSIMTAAMGVGGGLTLLAIMGQVMPPVALIPIHGLAQLGSNSGRAALLHSHINWRTVLYFVLGAIPGAIIAALIVIQLPLGILQLSVALFILWLVWAPKPVKHEVKRVRLMIDACFTTILSAFVGATGPVVAALLHRGKADKLETVATFSTVMSLQHFLKLFAFVFVGFQFAQWIPMTLAMIAAGGVGTWIGVHLLKRMPTQGFMLIFKSVLTLLALRLIWQAYLVW